jgi:hypothetical protein
MPVFAEMGGFARQFGRRWVALCARGMPIRSPGLCAALSAWFLLTGLCLVPHLESCARAAPVVSAALDGIADGWRRLRILERAMAWGAFGGAWIFQARCLQICWPDAFDPRAAGERGVRRFGRARGRRHGFVVAGMPVDLDDLRTSILVTGVTGSSKTAGVLLPAMAQLLRAYNRESDDERSADPFQKLGAFIPEVKGDLVDACIYLAHEAGRCVCRDVLILSPSCRIPVVRFRDERGRSWFLSGRGGSGGSDAGEWLPRIGFPAGHPRAGRTVPGNVLESPDEVAAIRPVLARLPIPLGVRRPRFLGWRWSRGRLFRVGHTVARDEPVPLRDGSGGLRWAEPPRTLSFDDVSYVDNGIAYNLVDARLPAAEAAERLFRLASMARGTAARGENDYFYEQGRKVVAGCIALHRAIDPRPCTAADVVRLATHEAQLGPALDRLDDEIARLREEAAGAEGGAEGASGESRRRRLGPLEDLATFFRDEWRKMVADGKTANIVKSTISGAFGVFLQDPNLAEAFCRPSTFSFEDVIQSGRIIGLVPGEGYEQLGRLLGTACKMDFQSTMLSRNGRADLNGTRLALYFADECHKYAISGSATAGDPYFMNLSRSNNVVNLCATQSYAWIVEVLGREAANVYISAFGVQFWLQQTDPETCRRASEICGLAPRDRPGPGEELDAAGICGALKGGRAPSVRRRVVEEEEPRFRPDDFALLNVGDIVAYNKGRPGRIAKVAKGRAEYEFCTRRPAGTAAVSARVREYYREVLENLAWERGEAGKWEAEAA